MVIGDEGAGQATAANAELGPALVTNDAVVAGMLCGILGLVFWSANSQVRLIRNFYKFVPMLLMCYFLPSLLTAFRIVDPDASQLYFVASHYLLPACLVLLTLSVDLGEILKLGPKALIMFLTGTAGVILGGPLAISDGGRIQSVRRGRQRFGGRLAGDE